MIFRRHVPRIKIPVLFLILSTFQTVWGQRPASNVQKAPNLITREQLIVLGRSLANCPGNDKPCVTFGAKEIASWLKNSRWREPANVGLDTLVFEDFTAFHKKYGNALGKLHYLSLGDGIYHAWVWNVTPEDGDWVVFVVDDCPRARIRPIDPDSLYHRDNLPNRCHDLLEIPVMAYSQSLAMLMANNKNGRVTVDKFVNFMLTKQ
jgi:hypothetical protein